MAPRHSFQVVFDGIDLDAVTVDRIRLAVQRAALRELADLDFRGDIAARIGDGGTQGVVVMALSEDQARGIGLPQPDALGG
jgi:hypothetical protein